MQQNGTLFQLIPDAIDLDPIEEFFAELKPFIQTQWHEYEDKTSKCSLHGVSV
jgi:hypothetical protein